MQKMQKIGIIAIAIFLLALIVFVIIYDSAIDKCVLKIDGVKYDLEDFDNYITLLEFEQNEEVDPKEVYEQYVNIKLFHQKAKEHGVTLTDDEIKSLEDNYESENVDKEKLAKIGFTKDDYMNYYKETLLASKFIENSGEYYPMSEIEYAASREQYVDMLKMYNYRVLQVTPEQVEEGKEEISETERKQAAKVKMESSLERLKNGEDFETVAKENGTYRFVTTVSGGYSLVNGQTESMPLLYLNETVTNMTLYTELIALEPGNYTNIIEDGEGYVIAYLESIDETPSDEAEARLKKDLNTIYAQQYILGTTEVIRNTAKVKAASGIVVEKEVSDEQQNVATENVKENNATEPGKVENESEIVAE
ncbi:MAG: hypothetical protein IKK43_00275 [Clostridia bacterium]|nr:hypothetical protein [Clostridia bacterium]